MNEIDLDDKLLTVIMQIINRNINKDEVKGEAA